MPLPDTGLLRRAGWRARRQAGPAGHRHLSAAVGVSGTGAALSLGLARARPVAAAGLLTVAAAGLLVVLLLTAAAAGLLVVLTVVQTHPVAMVAAR